MSTNKNFKVKNGIDAGSTITAPFFVGDGSGLTNIDTNDISVGILPILRGGTGTISTTGTTSSSNVFSDSPTFTGTPVAPTATIDSVSTQIATTAFVINQRSSADPLMNGTVSQGNSYRYSRQDHIHPIDTTRAPINSPSFIGTVTASTFSGALSGNSTTSSNCLGNSATATLANKASTLSQGGANGTAMTFNWSGQSGQPTWLWGGNDGGSMFVYNPSNFSVNYSNTSGSAAKWNTARNIALTGAVSGNTNIDGTGNVSITTSMSTPGFGTNNTTPATTAYVDGRFSWANNTLSIQVSSGAWVQVYPPLYA